MKGVILAGGFGTRLIPLTKVTNKHLLPVYNEPMIYKIIKTLTGSGINQITIVLGGESVGDFVRLLSNGEEFNAKFTYVYQKGAGGIAEALSLTKEIVGNSSVAVLLGDNIFEDTFAEYVKQFEEDSKNECYLFLKDVEDPKRFGVADIDVQGNIIEIVEKPEHPKSNYVVTGLYFYTSSVFDIIEKIKNTIGYSKRGELEITDVNNFYIKHGKCRAIFVKGFWSDAGTFETLLKASNFVRSKVRS